MTPNEIRTLLNNQPIGTYLTNTYETVRKGDTGGWILCTDKWAGGPVSLEVVIQVTHRLLNEGEPIGFS